MTFLLLAVCAAAFLRLLLLVYRDDGSNWSRWVLSIHFCIVGTFACSLHDRAVLVHQ